MTTAATKPGMLAGFRDFVARGNAIELAVGIVIGGAFTAIVTSIVDGIINPLIAGIFGQPNLDNLWTISLGAAQLKPGMVLTATINFLLVALAVYFLVVVPLNALASRRAQEEAAAGPAEDIVLLTEIRDLLRADGTRHEQVANDGR